MKERIIGLAKKFIAVRSVVDNPEGLNEILELALGELSGFTIEHFKRNGVKSALVYNTEHRPEKFKVLLNCHLDVIPGKDEQYTPHVEGDKLYGAGAMDMKSNVACAILAFSEVARDLPYPVAIQFVTDEQQGGFDGTKYQVEEGVTADFVIATEPTNFDIVHKAKGVMWLRVSASGKAAHGAYPWRGDNAVVKMTAFVQALLKAYPNPTQEEWVTTINVSTIETKNEAFNKIPDDCTAVLDVRYVAQDADRVLSGIRSLVEEYGIRLDVLTKEAAMDVSVDDAHLVALKRSTEKVLGKECVLRGAQGTSDARHFVAVGGAGVEFGPVGEDIGGDNEYASIPSLVTYYEILKEFLRTVK